MKRCSGVQPTLQDCYPIRRHFHPSRLTQILVTAATPSTPATPDGLTNVIAAPTLQPGAERPDVEHSTRPFVAISLDEAGLALRKAWLAYIVLALIPPAAMIASIFWLIFTYDRPVNADFGMYGGAEMAWLLVGMTWIGIVTPLGFVLRRKIWHEFYEGGVAKADNYLKGWLIIWIPLTIGGVLGFVGLAVTTGVSNVFTSMLAFVIFLSMAPNGHALTRPVGDHDDPGVYEEPK